MEANGSTRLYLQGDDTYRFGPNPEDRLELTLNGNAVSSTTFSNWTLLSVEGDGLGAYKAFWEKNDGSFGIWDVDANGAYVSGTAGVDATLWESFFSQDFNDDGDLG